MWKQLLTAGLFTISCAGLGYTQPLAEKVPSKKAEIQSTTQTAVLPATLPPDMFSGPAREAYHVASEIPEVLNELNCHCGCKRSQGHANLLYCFTDDHAAG